ncbi:hypothetical protein JCM8115_001919 [Rhodotorula mucilaginosa]
MNGAPDRPGWHTLNLSLPFPSSEDATLVKQTKQVALRVVGGDGDNPVGGLATSPTTSTSETSGRLGLAPPVALTSAASVNGAVKPRKRPRCSVAPEARLVLGHLRCRPPPPPPPAPPLSAVALPFLLSRHPRLPLVRPSQKKTTQRARPRSRSLSRSPPAPNGVRTSNGSTAVDADDGRNSSDEIEARWHDIVPALVDMPHLDSSDTESVDGTDRRYRPDRDPLSWQIESFSPDPALRPFRPWSVTQYKLVPMEPRVGRDTLLHPFDRGPMRRADAKAAQDTDLSAQRRAARKRKRSGKVEADDDDDDDDKSPPRPQKKAKSRREAENEVLQQLRQFEAEAAQADPDPDPDSDSHVSDSEGEPTVGFVYLAKRVLRERRERRRQRRAEGRILAVETTDDDDDDERPAPAPQV